MKDFVYALVVGKRGVKKGFTLIELLVVISIIALLIAILFPVFSQAREQSRRSVCANNLKQIYMTLMMYADDNDGWFPSVDYGSATIFMSPDPTIIFTAQGEMMSKYFKNKSILRCPSDDSAKLDPTLYYGKGANNYLRGASYRIMAARGHRVASDYPAGWYGWGYTGTRNGTYPGCQCPNVEFPGKTFQITGGSVTVPPASEQPAALDIMTPFNTLLSTGYASNIKGNHGNEGENIIFLDGHLEWRSAESIRVRVTVFYGGIYW